VSAPEWPVPVALDRLKEAPAPWRLAADAPTRLAVSDRFGLASLDRLEADLAVSRTAWGAKVQGRFRATGAQPCAVSGEPVPFDIDEPIAVDFAPLAQVGATDLELDPEALETMGIEQGCIDLGEAVAQSLALALDPYPQAPESVLAEARRHLLSDEAATAAEDARKAAASPFAALRKPV
jgi:uncharacterized metal-binding protein YceD (DUF177 family)